MLNYSTCIKFDTKANDMMLFRMVTKIEEEKIKIKIKLKRKNLRSSKISLQEESQNSSAVG